MALGEAVQVLEKQIADLTAISKIGGGSLRAS